MVRLRCDRGRTPRLHPPIIPTCPLFDGSAPNRPNPPPIGVKAPESVYATLGGALNDNRLPTAGCHAR